MEDTRLSEQEIVRRNKMQELIDKGIDPFGSRYERTASTQSIKDAYLNHTKEELEEKFPYPVISISAKEETGITTLEDTLKEMFFHGDLSFNDEIYITNMRHKEAIQNAEQSMKLVEESILNGMPEDFFSIDLMNAYKELGIVIGEEIEDDLANEIFSKFCMGK